MSSPNRTIIELATSEGHAAVLKARSLKLRTQAMRSTATDREKLLMMARSLEMQVEAIERASGRVVA